MKPHLLECVEMQNYKVEVQNHSEAMEAQDLFLKMGFRKELFSYSGYPKLVITDIDSIGGYSSGAEIGYLDADKITLPELRAMVSVQKYEELAKKYDGVKTKQLPNGIQFKKSKTSVTIYPSTGTIVSDVCGKINVLKKAGIGKLDHEMNKHFSVITPKQKEYLVKTDTGYTLQVLSDVVDGHDGIIEVPDGAEKLIYSKENNNNYHFVNAKNELWCVTTNDTKWYECGITYGGYFNGFGCVVVWKRESLNDQVASAEQARQEQTKCKCSTKELHESDLVNAGQSIMDSLVNGFSEGGFIPKSNHGIPAGLVDNGFSGFTQPEELPFVSDTQQTLNERQSQYGDFKDVAGMTQELLAVMEQYGYSDMPKPHKEALHMICSKMARIVNGDHNHLDSWHDIGGYAKLIENNIN